MLKFPTEVFFNQYDNMISTRNVVGPPRQLVWLSVRVHSIQKLNYVIAECRYGSAKRLVEATVTLRDAARGVPEQRGYCQIGIRDNENRKLDRGFDHRVSIHNEPAA